MNGIAIALDNLTVYWSGVIIALGIASALMLTQSLYTSHGGNRTAVLAFMPIALIFSVVLSRMLHWYCHSEQYAGFLKAVTDYSNGDFCLPGVVLGCYLAALTVRALGFTGNIGRLLDCFAPGAALCIGLIRLSALFNTSCRSKIAVENTLLQRLPFASQVSSGEYRFATFFVEFILFMLVFASLMRFFVRRRRYPMKGGQKRDGNTVLVLLMYYGAIELLLDSTRYDSSFLPFNGFVSVGQIAAAVCVFIPLLVFSIRSVRVNGMRFMHWAMWLGWVLAIGATGVLEYLVQRHGNWYLGCYGGMTLSCAMMAAIPYWMYLTVCDKRAAGRHRR